MNQQDIVKQILPQIQEAIQQMYADVAGEQNPENVYTADAKNIRVFTEDADVQQHIDYFAGKRKTKPSAKDGAEALMRQEQGIADGTLHETHITDATHKEALSRIRIPGSLQRHLKQVKIGGKM